jgi:hypothetical protein
MPPYFIGISQWLCIIVAVGGILAYLFGYKKGIAFTGGSIAFYVLLKFITIALGG